MHQLSCVWLPPVHLPDAFLAKSSAVVPACSRTPASLWRTRTERNPPGSRVFQLCRCVVAHTKVCALISAQARRKFRVFCCLQGSFSIFVVFLVKTNQLTWAVRFGGRMAKDLNLRWVKQKGKLSSKWPWLIEFSLLANMWVLHSKAKNKEACFLAGVNTNSIAIERWHTWPASLHMRRCSGYLCSWKRRIFVRCTHLHIYHLLLYLIYISQQQARKVLFESCV